MFSRSLATMLWVQNISRSNVNLLSARGLAGCLINADKILVLYRQCPGYIGNRFYQ